VEKTTKPGALRLHSSNIFRVIKSRIMRFAGNVARMGDKRGACRFLGRGNFEDLCLDGRIILKWFLICSIFRVLIGFVKCINNQ